MPNIIPVPIFSTNYYYISYDNNPMTKIKTVNLDVSLSQPSAGHVIVGYQTIIAWQPPGQTATVTTPTSPFPTVVNIDASIPGTIVMLAIVADNNPDPTKDKSYDAIFPRQNNGVPNFGRGPYSGVGPVPTQICYIVVQTPSGLSKPGKYHRDWMDMSGSYGDLVDAVDALVTNTGPLTSGIGRFDHIYEYTPGHNIWIHDRLEIRSTSEIRLNTAASPTLFSIITGAYDGVFPGVNLMLQSALNNDILLRRIGSVPNSNLFVHVSSGFVEIGVPGKTIRPKLLVDDINPSGINTGVHVSGVGAHTYDLGVDIVSPESNDTGVTVRGRGSHSFDLTTDFIRSDTPGLPLFVAGNASTVDLVAVDIATLNITELLPIGVRVEDVYFRNGKAASYVGGAISDRRPHPHVLASAFSGAQSTGGGVGGAPEIGLTVPIPANALASSMIRGTSIYTLVGGGNKRMVVSFSGVNILDFTTAAVGTLAVHVTIARTGLNQQRCYVQMVGAGVVLGVNITNTTQPEASLLQLLFGFRSVNVNAVTLECVSVTAGDTVVTYP